MQRKLHRYFLALVIVPLLLVGMAPTASLAKPVQDSGSTTMYIPEIHMNGPYWVQQGSEMAYITSAGGLSQMAAAKSGWVRKNALLWSDVQPSSSGSFDWNASSVKLLETELKSAAENGMEVILIVRSTPTWAQKNSGDYCGPIQQQYFDEFATFMAAAVRKFSVAPYYVKYWEIYNEPDIDRSEDPTNVPADSVYGCWGDKSDTYYGGAFYGNMLKTIYPAMKAVDYSAQILVGGLLLDCDPRTVCTTKKAPLFLKGILEAGAADSFDGISFHAYDYYQSTWSSYAYANGNWKSSWNGETPPDASGSFTFTGPVMLAKLDYIKEVLATYNVTGKYYINTEAALLYDSSDVMKQHYLTQSYVVGMAAGLRANIWYSTLGWTGRSTALLNSDLSVLPVYNAFKFSRSELGNALFSAEITDYEGVKAYKFVDGKKTIWVLWALDTTGSTITLPSVPTAAWTWDSVNTDYVSNIPSSTSLSVTPEPIYLEWE